MAIVNGLSYYKHGSQGQVVVVDNLGEVFEYTTIDALVGPREVVASSDRSVLWVFLQEFPLHIIYNGGTEEDAHGALALGEEVQLLFLGHGGAAFASGEDDGLGAFGDGELTS